MHADARRYLIAVVLLLMGAGLSAGARALRPTEALYKADFSAVPMEVEGFKGERVEIASEIQKYLAADAMEQRLYRRGDQTVSLSLIFGTDWRSIHAPTGCYPAQGWQIIHDRAVDLPPAQGLEAEGPVHARLLLATKDKAREMSLFVYARPGATSADWTYHVARMMAGPRGAGGLILILRTRPAPGKEKEAEELLRRFLAVVFPRAVAFWNAKPS
jgi:hypothetical protein